MEMKKLLESLQECGMDMSPAPMQQGTPVSMNVSLNASGSDHVQDLINMMKNAGLQAAEPVNAKMLSPRLDMERLRDIVDGPEMEADAAYADAATDDIEEWDNSPEGVEDEPEIKDASYMTKDLSGGINREKKAFKKAQDGDNAMAVEAIKTQLMQALAEKKAKPDFLDMDKDGNKKEPMKKAIADKKKGAVKEGSTGDYSAKKARAGKDIGKPGKNFAKIAKSAGEKYGSKERGEKVAGAVLAKLRKS